MSMPTKTLSETGGFRKLVQYLRTGVEMFFNPEKLAADANRDIPADALPLADLGNKSKPKYADGKYADAPTP